MIFTKNKKISFEYNIEKTFSAGIVLLGGEAKSIRVKGCSITESYCILRSGEVFITGMHIPQYFGSKLHIPKRDRKLLLKKNEINKIIGYKSKGFAFIPLEVFSQKSFIKILIGVCKTSSKVDKREKIKQRDEKRIDKNCF